MIKKVKVFLWQKKWIILALAVVVGGYWWWKSGQTNNEEVIVVKPELRDITEVLTVSGRVDAEEKVRMTFAGASKLTWLPVKEGDFVKKWQSLASVDSRMLRNQLEIAQNTHGKTFRAFETTLEAVDYYSESGLSQGERRTAENAQLDIRSSALAVESADVAVRLSYMSSPIEGIVTRIDQKNVGALMSPADGIEIINPASVFFSAIIDEEDVAKIRANQLAVIRLDAFDEAEFESLVRRVSFTPSMSETGGTGYQIWLDLPVDNSQMIYKLGMNGEAEIILNKKTAVLSIPVDALIEREGKQFVDVDRQGTIERIEVTTGITDEEYVEILTGLTADVLVVVPTP